MNESAHQELVGVATLEAAFSAALRATASAVPFEHRLLTIEDCCVFFGCARTTFDAMRAHPDFPKPVRVPTIKGGGERLGSAAPKWRAKDIINYVNDCVSA